MALCVPTEKDWALAGAKTAWGEDYNGLYDNKKDMQTMYNMLDFKKTTLQKSSTLLRDNLSVDPILSSMVSKKALSQEEANKIKMIKSEMDQVDKLINILLKKPVDSYTIFMELLKEERSDLYQLVRENEKKENRVTLKRKWKSDDQETVILKKFETYTLELSDSDIEYIANDLTPKQLDRLFSKLGITNEDKSNAIEDTLDPKEEAKYVLRYWRQRNENTREKIQVALNGCFLKETARNLMKIWGDDYKGREVGEPPTDS